MRPELEEMRREIENDPVGRLRGRVLRAFGALPTERRARRLTDREVVRLAMEMLIDRRAPAGAGAENPAFDERRFEELKKHG